MRFPNELTRCCAPSTLDNECSSVEKGKKGSRIHSAEWFGFFCFCCVPDTLLEKEQFVVASKAPVDLFLDYIRGPDPLAKRDALWILWKLSQDDSNKPRIRELGGLDPLIDLLESDSAEIRKNSLRTLCNLSFDGTWIFL